MTEDVPLPPPNIQLPNTDIGIGYTHAAVREIVRAAVLAERERVMGIFREWFEYDRGKLDPVGEEIAAAIRGKSVTSPAPE